MRACDLADDEQAEPEAARVSILRALAPLVELEQVFAQPSRDGRTLVVDPDLQGTCRVSRQGHGDRRIGRAVLERVGDEIRHELRDAIRVPGAGQAYRVALEANLPPRIRLAQLLDRALDDRKS